MINLVLVSVKKFIILKKLDKHVDIHSKCEYNRSCISNQQLPEGILLPLPLSLMSFISR